MNYLRHLLLCLCFLLPALGAKATGWEPDVITLDGEEWELLDKPIYGDTAATSRLARFLPKGRIISTANIMGYTAYWSTHHDSLCLDKIIVCFDSQNRLQRYDTVTYTPEALKHVFAPYYKEGKIHATWVNGKLRAGRGETIRYEHMYFARNLAHECLLTVEKGHIGNREYEHNYLIAGRKFEEAYKVLNKYFPFRQFPELFDQTIRIKLSEIRLDSISGSLLDCHITLAEDSNHHIVKDSADPRIQALKATLKYFTPWEIVRIDGRWQSPHKYYSTYMHSPVLTAYTREERLEAGVPVGYRDENGNDAVRYGMYRYCPGYNTITTFGLVQRQNGQTVGIDYRGEELFDVYHTSSGPDTLSEGYIRIINNQGLIGYADHWGNIVIEPRFNLASPFKDGRAKVSVINERKKKDFVIDPTGKTVD